MVALDLPYALTRRASHSLAAHFNVRRTLGSAEVRGQRLEAKRRHGRLAAAAGCSDIATRQLDCVRSDCTIIITYESPWLWQNPSDKRLDYGERMR